ncbi:hypothetical protein Nepgr_010441 [Nepenthes gracilis]|uniref:Uncharacterized protein n=1 Tax=Nepenthes gracilis TaxID=150966 RepID=A0AAD3SD64_NEPGR|nr:hypothetical protein Nepgr_010441 [Nepenthes gracilis]
MLLDLCPADAREQLIPMWSWAELLMVDVAGIVDSGSWRLAVAGEQLILMWCQAEILLVLTCPRCYGRAALVRGEKDESETLMHLDATAYALVVFLGRMMWKQCTFYGVCKTSPKTMLLAFAISFAI